MNRKGSQFEVLLIEDNPGDVFLISELLQDLELPLSITEAEDGRKALDILKEYHNHSSRPTPDFIILDLNLPKINGFDVLKVIRETPSLRQIPVVVMTGSLNKEDEIRSRCMGATDYLIKPGSAEDVDATSRWLRKNLIPLVRAKDTKQRPDTSGAVLVVYPSRFVPPMSRLEAQISMRFPDHDVPYDARQGFDHWGR